MTLEVQKARAMWLMSFHMYPLMSQYWKHPFWPMSQGPTHEQIHRGNILFPHTDDATQFSLEVEGNRSSVNYDNNR